MRRSRKVQRPRWLYRHVRKAEIQLFDRKGRPVRFAVIQRYKQPVEVVTVMERNPNKQVLWSVGSTGFGFATLVRYKDSGEYYLMCPDRFWRLRPHDLRELWRVLTAIVKPFRLPVTYPHVYLYKRVMELLKKLPKI